MALHTILYLTTTWHQIFSKSTEARHNISNFQQHYTMNTEHYTSETEETDSFIYRFLWQPEQFGRRRSAPLNWHGFVTSTYNLVAKWPAIRTGLAQLVIMGMFFSSPKLPDRFWVSPRLFNGLWATFLRLMARAWSWSIIDKRRSLRISGDIPPHPYAFIARTMKTSA
jgi:hypothetical protein